MNKNVLRTIKKDKIENVYKVIYVNIDFEKYQNYLNENGGDLSKLNLPLFATNRYKKSVCFKCMSPHVFARIRGDFLLLSNYPV